MREIKGDINGSKLILAKEIKSVTKRERKVMKKLFHLKKVHIYLKIFIFLILCQVSAIFLITNRNKTINKTTDEMQNKKNETKLLIKPIKVDIALQELLKGVEKIKNVTSNPKTLEEKHLKVLYTLAPRKVIGKKKIRIGKGYDDGYPMLDDFQGLTKIAYSFGINYQIAWDYEMANRGFDVYMYDHTIDNLPYYHSKFHWEKIGICSKSNRKPQLMTLEELLQKNGHANKSHMILKIDTEGNEEDVIIDSEEGTLEKFDQIIIEFHHFDMMSNEIWYNKVLNSLEKLNKTHQIINIHPSNYPNNKFLAGIPLPSVIEVLYAIRKVYNFSNDYSLYPDNNIDKKTVSFKDEVFLGFAGIFGIQEE